MSRFSKWAICLSLFFLVSAKSGKHSVWLVVSNNDPSGSPVNIQFSISGNTEGKTMSSEEQIATGIQQLPEKKIKEGVYTATISAHANLVSATQSFTLDADRWVLATYSKQDSASIVNAYGRIDTTQFARLGDKYVSIHLSITNRRPTGL